jgi:hypothetical protein
MDRPDPETLDPQALSAQLAAARRTLVAHDLLLRSLLTWLALRDPQGFQGVVGGFTRSKVYGSGGEAGALTREIADELAAMIEDIAASLPRN